MQRADAGAIQKRHLPLQSRIRLVVAREPLAQGDADPLAHLIGGRVGEGHDQKLIDVAPKRLGRVANQTTTPTTVEVVRTAATDVTTLRHSGLVTPESIERHERGWNGCFDSLERRFA